MSQKITIGYWKGPGKVQPSRYLLEISGVEYQETLYTDPAQWFGKDKYSLDLPFPNLPYLIDGDVKLTESETIFDYLVNKLNMSELLGKESDRFIVDNLRNIFSDLCTSLFQVFQKQGEEKLKIFNCQILPKANDIHKFLKNKEYLLGYFTVADLYFLSFARNFKSFMPEQYEEFAGTFDALKEKIESIPQIASYISEGRHPIL
ncbi:glutathione S-transferase, amine-terminal domain protein (macronuclear) [Tetrahymena thermophila SB210]|uniref:glutathione transferase n=1 Tax=Tetrahymena thermophila (strain SB210) TaxID=312017 RepID=I7ME95_TETTS|nr:glutathione S-transferase, amine-terminal domain protein [Tetrahymena thermophila SB210]EAR95757.1 glutathione S-transferase, amine-terminal domain protein [Tetrahymena thermophila SB210]|eukprot:XP_001016002.1 glutathione S-transferase, amine-terminal domain protein [Tetrahymena thermophila SB210]